MTSNIGIMQITSEFGTFDNTYNRKKTFRGKRDGISSKLIAKQRGNLINMDPWG